MQIITDINEHASSRLEGTGAMSQQQFQRYVIERMEKITVLCEQNNACTNRILQTTLTFFNSTLKSDGLPDLLLKNDNDLKKLEEMLSEKTVDADGKEILSPAYTYLV